MKASTFRALQALRAEGYAVVVFYPHELRGVASRSIEACLITRGNEAIDDLGDPDEDDSANEEV